MMITYLTAHIFEICEPSVCHPQRTVHLFKRLTAVIASNAFCLNILKEVLSQMHFGEVPAPLFIVLITSTLAIVKFLEREI